MQDGVLATALRRGVTRRVTSGVLSLAVAGFLSLGGMAATGVTASASQPTNTLPAGHTLHAGQELVAGAYRLVLQASDGNLVEYHNTTATWATGTVDHAGDHLTMQATDGNLVLYTNTGKALWASETQTHPGAYLVLGDDGIVSVVTRSGQPLWSNGHVLASDGQELKAGQQLSHDGYRLTLQRTGDLVLYGNAGQALWATATGGHPGDHLVLQSDGNLVLYAAGVGPAPTSNGPVLWTTNTGGHYSDFLTLQTDGNLVLYSKTSKALWASGTAGRIVDASQYAVSYRVSAAWTATPGYTGGGTAESGKSGFVVMNATGSVGSSLKTICHLVATGNVLHPYGTSPTVRTVTIAGRHSCYIWPSADAPSQPVRPGGPKFQSSAALIPYVRPVSNAGSKWQYLYITADPNHLEAIAQSVVFQGGH